MQAKKAFKSGEATTLQTIDGRAVELDGKQSKRCTPCDPDEVQPPGIDDLIKLKVLSEDAILHSLRMRFKGKFIYTRVSSILISVNPFQELPLYENDQIDTYQSSYNLPPHIFATACSAYKAMMADGVSQACIISGESGAGKTEATKRILQCLARVSKKQLGGGGKNRHNRSSTGEALEVQILRSNPVMEAFGNAKTVLNNNSSRFGKLISIKFAAKGNIVGASINHYLLEKSRVVKQADGEQNFHAFYYLLQGTSSDRQLLDLAEGGGEKKPGTKDFLLTSKGAAKPLVDAEGLAELSMAMEVLYIDKASQMVVWRIIVALLHLGNIEFEGDESAVVKPACAKTLESAAKLLLVGGEGGGTAALSKALREKQSGQIGGGDSYSIAYTVEQAEAARDAVTKEVYSMLFDWILMKINAALEMRVMRGKESQASSSSVHVLDIFGFEVFEKNSLEQLCINYCNEKLQCHFNDHIFKLEQAEYKAEKIVVDATAFSDNEPCIDLLEKSREGVFAIMDEELKLPRGSDEGFLSKLSKRHAGHANLGKTPPKLASTHFVIVHFAGEVQYEITQMLSKNKDTLHADLATVVKSCGASGGDDAGEMLQVILGIDKGMSAEAASGPPSRRGSSKINQPTLSAQFKLQLAALVQTLQSSDPHFVRCVKSNDKKLASTFDSKRVLQQLRYAGILEVSKVRQMGYPVRKPFDAFARRFRCISVKMTASKGKAKKAGEAKLADVKVLVAALVKQGVVVEGAIQLGKTKVFMKTVTWNALELKKDEVASELVLSAQAVARGFVARRRHQRCLQKLKELREMTAGMKKGTIDCDPQKLEGSVAVVEKLLPYPKSKAVTETAAAKALLQKLAKDAAALVTKLEKVTKTCAKAKSKTKEKEIASMKAVLAEVEADGASKLAKGFPALAKAVKEAKALQKKLVKEEKARKEAEALAVKKAAEAKAKAEQEAKAAKEAKEKAEKAEKEKKEKKEKKTKADNASAAAAAEAEAAEEKAAETAVAEEVAAAAAAAAAATTVEAEGEQEEEEEEEAQEPVSDSEDEKEEEPVPSTSGLMDQTQKGAVKVVAGSATAVGDYEVQFDCLKLSMSFCTSTDPSTGKGCMKVKAVMGVATQHAGVLAGDIILAVGVLGGGKSYAYTTQSVVGKDSQKALANTIRTAPRPLRMKLRRPPDARMSVASNTTTSSRGAAAEVNSLAAEMRISVGEALDLKETSSGMFKSATYQAFPVSTILPNGYEAIVVQKRYSEFDKLYNKVTKEKGLAILGLPPKKSGKLAGHDLLQRKQGLEIFLISIKESNSPAALKILLGFLGSESEYRECEQERFSN
jgi:myosin heavy subunit